MRQAEQARNAEHETPAADVGEENRLLRLLLDHMPDAVVLADGMGRWVLANRAARDPHGFALRLLSEGLSDEGELAELAASLRSNGRAAAERTVRDGKGRSRQVLVKGTSVAPDRFLVVARDVTERRDDEAELGKLRRVESLGYLTASAVHDFNNMLTPIVCLSAVLGRELERDSHAAEMASEIRETAERAAGLVRQMLSFVRREPDRPRRINVGAVVAELAGLLRRVLGEEVELAISNDDDAGDVVVDREQLEQVLINLAANARDAMPRGGRFLVAITPVTLVGGEDEVPAASFADMTSTHAMARTPAAGAASGAYVAVRVSDTGVGMSPEVRERVFERFFTTKAPGEGSGLGLAAAHRFARSSGGCISVRSTEGVGTTITLCIPRAQAEVASGPPSQERLPRGTETVLLAEDDPPVRSVIRALLEAQGYRVLEADCGKSALEVAAREPGPIDLLVADVVMPEMSGRVLADTLAAMGVTSRVLFISGHTDRTIRERGVNETSSSLLRKAFSPAELLAKVREVLGGTKVADSASA